MSRLMDWLLGRPALDEEAEHLRELFDEGYREALRRMDRDALKEGRGRAFREGIAKAYEEKGLRQPLGPGVAPFPDPNSGEFG